LIEPGPNRDWALAVTDGAIEALTSLRNWLDVAIATKINERAFHASEILKGAV
jgi:hypothetical protein